jgi:predicted regulator of Ras-like GTPase activity (Roadblock/LC7/MglB family)
MNKSLILPVEQVERIERILDVLCINTRSSYVFLSDISGQVIDARGATRSTDIVTLAALMAGNMAATAEMALMIGEERPFHLMFHEGEKSNIYLSQVGETFLLAVVFASEIPIGLVRMFSKRAVEELQSIAKEYESVVSETPGMMEAGFSRAIDEAFDAMLAMKDKISTDSIITR